MSMNRREFLQKSSSALLVGGATLASSGPLQQAMADERVHYGFWKKGQWRNWPHNVVLKPKEIVRPKTLRELQEIVHRSKHVRAVGSGHSISTIAYTEETLMDTAGLKGIVGIDTARGIVRVRGGSKLWDFNDELADRGWMLPSTGDTGYQSLAGLLSTGTHGTGMKWGSCSDEESLVGMKIVNANGDLVSLSADHAADLPLLRATRIGLGSFGINYTVDLKAVPKHNIEHEGSESTLDRIFSEKPWLTYDHFEFAFFPYADKCYQFKRRKTMEPITATKLDRWYHKMFLENIMAKVLLNVSSKIPEAMPRILEQFVKSFPHEKYIDRADRVMTIRRITPTHLMEVAIPIEKARDAIEAYRALIAKYATLDNKAERFYANLPLQIRFVRADRGTLISCADGRDTCWFGLGSYYKNKGWEPMFREMERELIKLGGRPHWGKIYFTNQVDRHPGFAEWEQRRAAFDPTGKFVSRYLERMKSLPLAPSGQVF